MGIYNGMLPVIDRSEVVRYAGLHRAENFPPAYIEDAIKEVQLLAAPKGIYQLYDYDAEAYTIKSTPPLFTEGKSIQKHLAKAEKVYVMAVTIGEDVEIRSTELFREGNYTAGLLLDAAATTAVEQVADQVNAVIESSAKKLGYKTTWRFSPGYGDWPLETQKALAHLIQTEAIGLTVTDSFLLFPRKSVTAIIGCMSEEFETNTAHGCSSCTQKNCPSRKTGR